MPKKRLEKIIEQTELNLELMRDLGIKELSRERVEPLFGKKIAALRKLELEEMGNCERCKLCKERNLIVFGEGDANAGIFFVGEAPGETEDLTGRPFAGPAGKILTDIIERGMRIPRSRVFITSVLKCRPPKNREPAPEEIEACRGFLEKQINIVRPKVVVALGKVAAHCLLKSSEPISRLRGEWAEFNGIRVMPTYHPSYLIYNPSGKREVWSDIKKVLHFLSEEKQ